MRFKLGIVVATPAAIAAIAKAGASTDDLITRHLNLEQGVLDKEDHEQNALALKHGLRIFSAFALSDDEKVWIITEYDRTLTTILLPADY
jgi:hypothetical protein